MDAFNLNAMMIVFYLKSTRIFELLRKFQFVNLTPICNKKSYNFGKRLPRNPNSANTLHS